MPPPGLVSGGDVRAVDGRDEGVERACARPRGRRAPRLRARLRRLASALRLASAAAFALASASWRRRAGGAVGLVAELRPRVSSAMTGVRPVSSGGRCCRGRRRRPGRRGCRRHPWWRSRRYRRCLRSGAPAGTGPMLPGGTGERHGGAESFPSFSPTGLADGFGAGRSPTGPLRTKAPDSPQGLGSPAPPARACGDSAMTVRCRGCGGLLPNSRTDAMRIIFQSPKIQHLL